ncbi:MAG: alpha/beta fold hydrolase, partial [Mesorhizobium sp.]
MTLPDGSTLYYEQYGNAGPAVLLCTGLGGLASFWHEYVGELASSYRVICYDHRGTGKSTASPPPYSVDDMVNDAVELLDGLGVEKVHFCGHSTGGAI